MIAPSTQTTLPDFDDYCEAACIEYWGQPDRRNSKELCWGPRNGYGGRSYNIKKKRWYDAEAKRGGSTLQLIALQEGYTNAAGKPDTRGKHFFDVWRIGYEKKIITEPPPESRDQKIRKVFPYPDEGGNYFMRSSASTPKITTSAFVIGCPPANGNWAGRAASRIAYRR
jgi:hypothetical protein